MLLLALARIALGCSTLAQARLIHGNVPPRPSLPAIGAAYGPVFGRGGTELAPYSTTYYFDQLIDHNNPSLGTFQQRFWFTSEHYEPGRPPYF